MEQKATQRKLPYILLAILSVLLIVGSIVWYFWGDKVVDTTTGLSFPFGTPSADITTPRNGNGGQGIDTGGQGNTGGTPSSLFHQLTTKPVAGAYAVTQGGVTMIRYVEKETGHIFDVSPLGQNPTQVTNTTIPRIAEATFALGGRAVVLRYLDDDTMTRKEVIKTLIGYITTSSGGGETMGTLSTKFLPDNILSVTVSPDGKTLFYIIPDGNGVSGSLVSIETKTSKEVFSSTFSEWTPQLLSSGEILLTTKPSGGVAGFAYKYNPNTRELVHILREKKGLTTLGNSSGEKILFGEITPANMSLGTYSVEGFSGDEGIVDHESILPVTGLPEKCAWQHDNDYAICAATENTPRALLPDQWYQGLISFADIFWRINSATGEIELLAKPETEIDHPIDVINPVLTPADDFFVFSDKKDGALWSLRLEKQATAGIAPTTPDLSPGELMDAAGSIGTEKKP